MRGRAKERITSRFSKSDSEGGDNEDTLEDEDEEGEGEGGKGMADKEGGTEEVVSPDVWATPREEGGRYGFFGREVTLGRDGEEDMF